MYVIKKAMMLSNKIENLVVPNIYFYLFNEFKIKMQGKNMLNMWACVPDSLERNITHRETFFLYTHTHTHIRDDLPTCCCGLIKQMHLIVL